MKVEFLPWPKGFPDGRKAKIDDILRTLLESQEFRDLMYRRICDTDLGSIEFVNLLSVLESQAVARAAKHE